MLKHSRQRDRILEVLKETKSHPTADWIYSQVKSEFPRLSLGTVYTNLKLLKEQGKIIELNFGSTFSRFDGRTDNHYHFLCRKCGKIFDVDMPLEMKLDKKAAKTTGFNIQDHRLKFYGVCKECVKTLSRRVKMKMDELRAKAKSLGLKTVGIKKSELIRSIQRAEGNFDCFGTPIDYCDQLQCCFRSLCLDQNKKPRATW